MPFHRSGVFKLRGILFVHEHHGVLVVPFHCLYSKLAFRLAARESQRPLLEFLWDFRHDALLIGRIGVLLNNDHA